MANIIKTDPEKSFRRVLSASTLSGDSVKNLADEDLGKIKELMIDIPSGRVAYAVLSFGGFLGMGDKLFAGAVGRTDPGRRSKMLCARCG
jgi:hypothetical protein